MCSKHRFLPFCGQAIGYKILILWPSLQRVLISLSCKAKVIQKRTRLLTSPGETVRTNPSRIGYQRPSNSPREFFITNVLCIGDQKDLQEGIL